MKKVEGNRTISKVEKFKGEAIGHQATYEGSGKVAEHTVARLPRVGFEAGRTIELRRFEFCRMKLGLHVSVPESISMIAAEDAICAFVLGMLKREEQAVVGRPSPVELSENARGVLAQCSCRTIYLLYGLTLQAAKQFESHQVDVIEELPISDSEDLIVEWEKLSDEMAAKLHEQHERIKTIGIDTGI